MARIVPQMVTAQWLVGGESIYWTGMAWSENFDDGAVFAEPAAADEALVTVQSFVKDRIVVGPYLMEVAMDGVSPRPTSARERIRAAHNATFAIDHGSWTARIAG